MTPEYVTYKDCEQFRTEICDKVEVECDAVKRKLCDDLRLHDAQAKVILDRIEGTDEVIEHVARMVGEIAVLQKNSEMRLAKNEERLFKISERLLYLVSAVVLTLIGIKVMGIQLGV